MVALALSASSMILMTLSPSPLGRAGSPWACRVSLGVPGQPNHSSDMLARAGGAPAGGNRVRERDPGGPLATVPQEQAHGRLRLRRRLPARPLYGQVDVGAASCSATASGCGTCPNPGGGLARCRSSPLLTAPAPAGPCTA